jgi:hypothetical protein
VGNNHFVSLQNVVAFLPIYSYSYHDWIVCGVDEVGQVQIKWQHKHSEDKEWDDTSNLCVLAGCFGSGPRGVIQSTTTTGEIGHDGP